MPGWLITADVEIVTAPPAIQAEASLDGRWPDVEDDVDVESEFIPGGGIAEHAEPEAQVHLELVADDGQVVHRETRTVDADSSQRLVFGVPEDMQGADGGVVDIALSASDASGKPANLRVFGVSAGPEDDQAAVSGSDKIVDINFGPPGMFHSGAQATAYSFYSRFDFEHAEAAFLRVDESSDDKLLSVNEQLLPFKIAKGSWVGKDGAYQWNGTDRDKTPSLGQHELRVRAWNRTRRWHVGYSDGRVTVSQ
jgi:hypothetical protein